MDKVRHKWAYREHHRVEWTLDDRSRQAIEHAAIRNAAAQALTEGTDLVGNPTVEWTHVDQVEAVQWSRVDRDTDPWVKQWGPDGPTEWDVAAEEQRRLTWWLECRELRVSFDIDAEPEAPRNVSLSDAAWVELSRQGAQVLVSKTTAPAICGGALRRHSFAPRDATWLRDGLIDLAHCNDCDRDVTRDELLERGRNEAAHGTCHVDGDAFVLVGNPPSGLICPTCTAAFRRE